MRNDLFVITIRLANCTSKNAHEQINILFSMQHWALYMKTFVLRFIVAGEINVPQKYCCVSLNIFILLTATCSQTTHRIHCCISTATTVM